MRVEIPKIKFEAESSLTESMRELQEIERRKNNPAMWTYERLMKYIQDFEQDLDSEHEVGARFTGDGNGKMFHIQNVGYWGPDIVVFNGVYPDDNNTRVQLIQHYTQLNVLLIAAPKIEETARRVGFFVEEEKEEELQ